MDVHAGTASEFLALAVVVAHMGRLAADVARVHLLGRDAVLARELVMVFVEVDKDGVLAAGGAFL